MNGTVFLEPTDEASIVPETALLLAAAAGVFLPRWSHGLGVGVVVVVVSTVLWTVVLALAFGKPIPWWSFEYGIVWASVLIDYVRWLAVFFVVFGVRKTVEHVTLRMAG